MKNQQRVRISGEVEYNNYWYRVLSNGIIIEIGEKKSLVNIDMIDGDNNVNIYVNNNIIYDIE